MNMLDAIRTLRKEREMTFEQARQEAIDFWVAKGWPLPTWAEKFAPKARAN